jgi:hypothetical protein
MDSQTSIGVAPALAEFYIHQYSQPQYWWNIVLAQVTLFQGKWNYAMLWI